MQVENLTASQRLSQHGLLDQCNTVLSNKGFDRQTSCGRSGDDREVAEAAQREPSGVLWRIIDRRPFEGAVLPATERKCGIPL